MKLMLKKVKIHEDMSEETTCFSAEMWENGVKIGEVRNDGRGGCHDIRPTKGNEKAALKYDENLSLDLNRENYPIDYLIEEWDAVTRHQAKKLVLVGDATGKVFTLPMKHSISAISKNPTLLSQVIAIAHKQKEQGFTVINRNINIPYKNK